MDGCRPLASNHCAISRFQELADIRRGSSLRNIHVSVGVSTPATGRLAVGIVVNMSVAQCAKWSFATTLAGVKAFETRVLRTVKSHIRQNKSRHSSFWPFGSLHTDCTMCNQLEKQLKHWERIPKWATIGRNQLSEKIYLAKTFFYNLMKLIALNSSFLPSCNSLREVWRMVDEVCHIEYRDDERAVGTLKTLKPVATPQKLTASYVESEDGEDCAICLDRLHHPEDPELATARGVELTCGHRFHDSCLCVWFHSSVNCPMCRSAGDANVATY